MRGEVRKDSSHTDTCTLEMSIKGIASCACPGLDPIAVSGKRRVGRLDDRVGR